jgi:predicted O-methyltransferase YrrM
MQDILSTIYDYADLHSGYRDELLDEVERATHLRTLSPRMLSGRIQGAMLQWISLLSKPNAILEIGTFTGYATLCLVRGLAAGGQLHTIEVNPEHAAIAADFFKKSSRCDQIQMHIGDASALIPQLACAWDLVFIDADKERNGHYFDLVIDHCRPGGLILVDNVLWNGKVTEPVMDRKTKSIDDFNKKIRNDSRVENLLLPLRDGLQIIRKIG